MTAASDVSNCCPSIVPIVSVSNWTVCLRLRPALLSLRRQLCFVFPQRLHGISKELRFRNPLIGCAMRKLMIAGTLIAKNAA